MGKISYYGAKMRYADKRWKYTMSDDDQDDWDSINGI